MYSIQQVNSATNYYKFRPAKFCFVVYTKENKGLRLTPIKFNNKGTHKIGEGHIYKNIRFVYVISNKIILNIGNCFF